MEATAPVPLEIVVVPPFPEPAISILPGESLAKYQNVSPSSDENSSQGENIVADKFGSVADRIPVANHPEGVAAGQNDLTLPEVTRSEIDSLEYAVDAPAEEDEETQESLTPEKSESSHPILVPTRFPDVVPFSAHELPSLEQDHERSIEMDGTPLVEATEEDLVEAREIALEGVADIPSQFKPSQADF